MKYILICAFVLIPMSLLSMDNQEESTRVSFDKETMRFYAYLSITDEDHKNFTNDLVKLVKATLKERQVTLKEERDDLGNKLANIKNNPLIITMHYEQISAFCMLGMCEDAESIFKYNLSHEIPMLCAQLAMLIGNAHKNLSRWKTARKWYNKSLSYFPENPGAMSDIGLMLHNEGNAAKALKYIKKAIDNGMKIDDIEIKFENDIIGANFLEDIKKEMEFKK